MARVNVIPLDAQLSPSLQLLPPLCLENICGNREGGLYFRHLGLKKKEYGISCYIT